MDLEFKQMRKQKITTVMLAQRPIIDLEIHNFLYRDRLAMLSEMFGMLAPLQYVYSVLPEPHSGIIQAIGWKIDLSELAKWDNPHVFCLPIWAQTPSASNKRKWRWQLGGWR